MVIIFLVLVFFYVVETPLFCGRGVCAHMAFMDW